LRGFLGLTRYYRKFLEGYDSISKPLTKLLKKNSFKRSEEANQVFQALKYAMCHALVAAILNFNNPLKIDASDRDRRTRAILMQGKRPMTFLSKALGV
jgi:hypothetical protein